MKEELGYICPQSKKQCDDECCVSAEDCHAEAINSIISNCEPEQLNQNKMTAELIDHNIATFVRRIGEMPSGILLHPTSVVKLVDNYKEAFGNINTMNIYLTPIKYRGITIYQSLGINENEVKLVYEL